MGGVGPLKKAKDNATILKLISLTDFQL